MSLVDPGPTEKTILAPPSKAVGGPGPGVVTQDRSVVIQEPFTIEDARRAMERHAEEKCCLKGGIAHELNIIEMTAMSAVHIVFESTTEGRSTSTATAPHQPGAPVDGPQNGPAPQPWDILVQPTRLFHDEHRALELPHTSTIDGCDRCARRGTIACSSCTGVGTLVCVGCHGSGTVVLHHHHSTGSHHHHHHSSSDSHHHHHHHHHETRQTCGRCGGSGRSRCVTCVGTGFVTCTTCTGTGVIRRYIKLDVNWKLYKSERVVDPSGLAANLIRGAGGVLMFQEEDAAIRPVSHLPQPNINQACNELVASQKLPSVELLLRQRIQVRCIPVYEVHYTHKSPELRRFWVFGTDRQVYQENYPSCLSCSIL